MVEHEPIGERHLDPMLRIATLMLSAISRFSVTGCKPLIGISSKRQLAVWDSDGFHCRVCQLHSIIKATLASFAGTGTASTRPYTEEGGHVDFPLEARHWGQYGHHWPSWSTKPCICYPRPPLSCLAHGATTWPDTAVRQKFKSTTAGKSTMESLSAFSLPSPTFTGGAGGVGGVGTTGGFGGSGGLGTLLEWIKGYSVILHANLNKWDPGIMPYTWWSDHGLEIQLKAHATVHGQRARNMSGSLQLVALAVLAAQLWQPDTTCCCWWVPNVCMTCSNIQSIAISETENKVGYMERNAPGASYKPCNRCSQWIVFKYMYKLSCFNHSLHALASHRGVPSWHHMLTMMWLRKNHIFLLPSPCARLGYFLWIWSLAPHGDNELFPKRFSCCFAHLLFLFPMRRWTRWLWWFLVLWWESHIDTNNLKSNKEWKRKSSTHCLLATTPQLVGLLLIGDELVKKKKTSLSWETNSKNMLPSCRWHLFSPVTNIDSNSNHFVGQICVLRKTTW